MTDQQRRILMVEDSEDIQSLLGGLLESQGYMVDYASDGTHALKLLRTGAGVPSLILLDLMMPGMDGYEFRRQQELHPATALIPVVVMTADSDIESKALKIGAKGYLKKPFLDLDTILKTVGRFFPT
jgi:CheY-like chemotaxis protein